MARPSKLTPEVEERIIKALLAGSHVATAARCAGVHPATFYRWIERGDPNGTGRADRPYRVFAARVDQTMAEAEVRQLARINKAGETRWEAHAWLLARRYPERWGRRAAIQPDAAPPRAPRTQNPSRTPSLAITALSDQELAVLARLTGAAQPPQDPTSAPATRDETWLLLAQEIWEERYRRVVPLDCEIGREWISASLDAIAHGNTLDDPELTALRDKAAAQHGLPPRPS